MMSPMKAFKPDYSPVVKMMEMQTKLVIETSQAMMELAMLPWKGMPLMTLPKMGAMPVMTAGFGSICNPAGSSKAAPVETVIEAPKKAAKKAPKKAAEVIEAEVVATEEVAETAAETVETVTETAAETVEATTATVAETATEVTETTAEAAAEIVEEAVGVAPEMLDAPIGEADDLTVINGVGPKLAETLNAAGIYHLFQIAEWTEDNVAWVDANIAGVRGRASKNGWVAQATDLSA